MSQYRSQNYIQVTDNITTLALDVENLTGLTAQAVAVTSFDTGSFQLQISLNGTQFVNFGTPLTANGRVEAIPVCKKARWLVTLIAAASADVDCAIAGLDPNRKP